MRFKKIQIPSFGPFTELEIDFPKTESDFHLIYGPNEAGKSSLLRALRGFFFGIPIRTADNFLHDNPKLRIAAELERQDGSLRFFQRRKGSVNTLLDPDETPLPESALTEFLGAVDAAYFDNMFGLGSDELRQGADELLRGKGRLGEALFSASLGGTPVDQVIRALEDEAARTFSGRASRSIRKASASFKEQLRTARSSVVKPETWEETEREIATLSATRQALIEQKQEKLNRKTWLERCRDALPTVGILSEEARLLADLPLLPELPESFSEEIKRFRDEWQTAAKKIRDLEDQLQSQETLAKGCSLKPEILEAAPAVERLHGEVGIYRESRSQKDRKTTEADQIRKRIEKGCRDLEIEVALEELETVRVTEPDFLAAQETADSVTEAEAKLAEARDQEKRLEAEMEKLESQSDAETDTTCLATLEKAIQSATALESASLEMAMEEKQVQALNTTLSGLHRQLAGAPDDIASVPQLPIPLRATIERFRESFRESAAISAQFEEKHAKLQSDTESLTADLQRLERQRDLPTLTDLAASRAERDRGWRLVLEDWKGDGTEESLVEGKPLEAAYPEAVAAADQLADRLRVEAEAVAQMEEKRSQISLAEKARQEIADQQALHDKERADLESEWAAAWASCHIQPLSPKEMSEWRETWEKFNRTWEEWNARSETLQKKDAAVEQAIADLSAALKVEANDFASLLADAREKADRLKKAVGAKESRDRLLEEKTSELRDLSQTLPPLEETETASKEAWDSARKKLALPAGLSPANAIEVLRQRRELLRDYDRWSELRSECTELQNRIDEYEKQATSLRQSLGIDAEDAENTEALLRSLLQTARNEQTNFDNFQEQISLTQTELEEVRHQCARARESFDERLKEAQLADDTELGTFLHQFETRAKLRNRSEELRGVLASLSRGESLDAFIQKVKKEEPELLEGSLSGLDAEISELDEEIEETRASAQEWETQKRKMEKASDESALAAQNAELSAARMRDDAERFVRLQMALSILRGQIDRFREQNQGPFMEKAGQWFQEITGSAFAGITTTYEAGDEPVIAGLRAGDDVANETVLVDGMSEGTRDQLFLALRLAGLELHLEEHEPMPMILDDLLVHFDDGRAAQALKALSRLGQQSQVLLFTHHAHLIDVARDTLGEEGFQLTRLER